jgi:hypothetical protein
MIAYYKVVRLALSKLFHFVPYVLITESGFKLLPLCDAVIAKFHQEFVKSSNLIFEQIEGEEVKWRSPVGYSL